MPAALPPAFKDRMVQPYLPGRRWARRSLGVVACLALVVMIGLLQLGQNGLVAWFKLDRQAADLHRRVDVLQAANQQLETRIDAVLHDPEALERLARERFDLRRPDEEVLLILPEERLAPDPGGGSRTQVP